MAKSLKEISNSVKSGTYKASPMAAAVANRKKAPEPIKIDTVEYDVPMSAIYDRMNDGSYMAKYENYLGAEGNEERLARQQSTGSKWSNGLLKNAAKTAVYAADSLAGTIYGLGKYATTGDFSDMYDNELTSYFDDVNKGLDNRLANYYTQEEKSKNIIEKLGTANFWANDVAGGFAFVGGALLSEAAVGALTGGASLGVGAAKFSAKFLGKTLAKEGIDKAGKKAIKGLMAAKYGKTGGDIAKTFAFTLRTSNFEAGMEARQNYKQAVDTYLDKFEELNGRKPTYDEQKIFFDNAKTASNLVYGSNLAILGVSNAVMFGKKLLPSSITKPITNSLNRVVGLGTKTIVEDGVTKTVMRGANKAQKILGNTVNIASKPLTEGLFEEGLQGVAGKTMQKYLDSKYNPNALEGYDAWSAFHDSMSEQYTSKEGWNEIGIGMIIGLAGGGLNPAAIKSGHALPGFFKNSWKNQYKSKEAGLDRANKGIEALASLNRVSAVKAMSKDGGDYNESVENYNFIRSQEHIKDKSDIIEDYETVINSIDFEENQELRSQLEDMGISPETYKEDSINNFKEFYKTYDSSRKSIEALGLNSALQDTPGNISEVADSLMIQIVTGKDAYNKAKNIGQDLSDTIGVSGMFDYHDFYNRLSAEDVVKADELKEQKTRLKSLQDEAISIGQELSVLSAQKKAATDPNALQGKFNEVSQKATLTQQEIQKTTGRVSELTSLLNKSLISSKFDITKLNSKDMNIDLDINSVIDNVSMVDDYIDALEKEGRAADASVIRYKQRNLQANLIAHTEMVNSYRRMLDSNFFSSKEGKTLVSRLLGSKYEMSEDFRSLINENEEKLFNSLKLTGQIEFGQLVDDKLKEVIQNNQDISDREKHRLESLIRLQLSANALRNITKDLGIASDEITTAEVETNENSLTGDTVTIKSKIELTTTNLNNIQELDKAIKSITAELEYVVNQSQDNKDKVEAMTAELKDLLERKAEIETSLGKTTTTDTRTSKADSTISNGDKIISVQTKSITNEITDTAEDLFVLPNENPEGRVHINMDPLKDILVVPNNILTVIDKKTGKEVVNKELNSEGAVIFEAMQGRLFVIANINGQLVPFYKSSAGTSGKIQGAWYPFFGYTGAWLVKGSIDKTTGKMSYSPEIDRVTDLLNENLIFPDKYIDRTSNSIKNTKGEVIVDMNQFFKVNRLWQKEFGFQTGTGTNYQIKGLKENTRSESGLVALITGLNTTELDSSKTKKENSEWFNLISKNAELAALGQTTTTNNQTDIEAKINITPEHREILNMLPNYSKVKISIENDRGGLGYVGDFNERESELDKTSRMSTTIKYSGLPSSEIYTHELLHYFTIPALLQYKQGNVVGNIKTYVEGLNTLYQKAKSLGYSPINGVSIHDNLNEFAVNITNTNSVENLKQIGIYSDLIQLTQNYLESLTNPVQQNAPFSDTEQEELVNINNRIAELEAKIKEGNQEFKITESEDYLRFEELAAKLDRGETSPQEEAEMEGLRKSLDQWTFITGVVVKGFRLSDLIQQKSALESAIINVAESIEVPTVEDVMESVSLDDIKQRSNYNLAQSYDKVVVSKRNGNYVIHNMLDSDFEAMVEGLGVAPISDPTGKNNIILSEEDFQKLPIKLFNISTNKRNYSPALEVLPDKNGADSLFVINSGQKIEEGHDVQALYESNADDPVTLSVDVEYPYNKSIIERYRKAVKNLKGKTRFTKEEKQAMEDSLNEIRRDLNISVFRGGKKIATLKGSRRTTMNNTTDVVFENLRASISESMDFLDAIADPYQKGYVNVVVNNKEGDVVIPDITIQKIYLGFPNLNYQINEDGEAVVESRPVSDTEASKIIDLGYMRKGKTFTRDGETVDKTFMSSLETRSEKKDVPFIVLNVGGKRVAYPVKVNVQRTIDTEEFESIYNNDSLTDSAKSIQLNKWMAAHGVDVKIPGNAFISFGDSNVNDDNFFQDKLAQIKRINYFYKVTDWINTKNAIEDIVKSQISVDINLENPFHSPKVQLNYDNLGLNVIVKNKPATNNAKSVKSNPKPSNIFNCK